MLWVPLERRLTEEEDEEEDSSDREALFQQHSNITTFQHSKITIHNPLPFFLPFSSFLPFLPFLPINPLPYPDLLLVHSAPTLRVQEGHGNKINTIKKPLPSSVVFSFHHEDRQTSSTRFWPFFQ